MSHDDEALRQALGTLTATTAWVEHPSAEQLLDYHEGHLPGPEIEELRFHLARCSECSRVLLDLASSGEAENEDPELDAAWAQLSPQLVAAASSGEVPTVGERAHLGSRTPDTVPPPTRTPAWPLALAASLGLIVGGLLATGLIDQNPQVLDLTAQVERLETELAELQRPSSGVPSQTLLPDGFLRDDTVPTLEIPPSVRQVVLVLAGSDPLPDDSYRLEVLDAGGDSLWQLDNLNADNRGHFTLVVSPEALPAGEVVLHLFHSGMVEPVSYRLRVR